jgi:lipid-binding SYLF domain-containing protein
MQRLYATVRSSRELVAKSRGVLVFPSVIKAGFLVGAQYGKGAVRVSGSTVGYYSTTSASVGLQAGAQSKALILPRCVMQK